MAGSSLLTLIDDIATLLDDVAVMTKVAMKKTAGVLGDDLALNAQQVTGVNADRELPVVWAVAKGSFVNKLILVPSALLISAVLPAAVTPLLMIGGLFLCFEGFEKVAHKLFHTKEEDAADHRALVAAVGDEAVDMVAFERDRIKGAVRTDFILSAEIIVISLGTIAAAPFGKQVAVLSAVAVAMTIGVYGLVAGIVKLDDLGLRLRRGGAAARAMGNGILRVAPLLMRFLGIAGTAAMFLVGGGILAHGIGILHHLVEDIEASAGAIPDVGFLLGGLAGAVTNGVVGVVAGGLAVGLVTLVKPVYMKLRGRRAAG